MNTRTDSIIAFAVKLAIQQRPELVHAEILKLLRQKAKLEEENLELRRLVGRLRVAGIEGKGGQNRTF